MNCENSYFNQRSKNESALIPYKGNVERTETMCGRKEEDEEFYLY